jgi:hypothetical protein
MTDETTDDDGWWEMVFSAKDYIAMNRGCERGECFTFACQCRRDAISRVARDTEVNYATDEN